MSRPGARCRDYSRSVSPDRSPNGGAPPEDEPFIGPRRRVSEMQAKLHPDQSVDRGPSPSDHAGCVRPGNDRNGSRVHLQLARRRRSPTLSLRHRHDYPAALHRGLPDKHPHANRKFPISTNGRNGCAPHPAHIHQIGAGEPLRDVVTLVPRVLLFVTLAEPTPSGSTGMSRLCQGCSHPPRHLPGRAALSCTALLRQDGDEGLPPRFELSAPHGARGSRFRPRPAAM